MFRNIMKGIIKTRRFMLLNMLLQRIIRTEAPEKRFTKTI